MKMVLTAKDKMKAFSVQEKELTLFEIRSNLPKNNHQISVHMSGYSNT